LIRSAQEKKDEDALADAVTTASVPVGLNDPGTIYEFKLTRSFKFGSSVAGVMNNYSTFDPTFMAEYSSLTALFSMVKLKRAEAFFSRNLSTAVPTTTSSGDWDPMVVNILYDDVGAPGSYAGALDSPNFKVWNYAFDTMRSPLHLALDFTKQKLQWADSASPSSATQPGVGCPGCIQIYGESQPVSTNTVFVILSLWVLFTNRI